MWGKAAELAVCLDNHQPDILKGTETWFDDSISNSEIIPSNYTVICKDRKDGFGADGNGGVFIALKNDLIASHRIDLDSEAKIIWAQIELAGSRPVLVGAYYRPPNSKNEVLSQLEASLTKLTCQSLPTSGLQTTSTWLVLTGLTKPLCQIVPNLVFADK